MTELAAAGAVLLVGLVILAIAIGASRSAARSDQKLKQAESNEEARRKYDKSLVANLGRLSARILRLLDNSRK